MTTSLTDGMDPGLVSQHTKFLHSTADSIRGLGGRVQKRVTTLAWKGADREQFIASSTKDLGKTLERVAIGLTDRAKRLDGEVAKQVETSKT